MTASNRYPAHVFWSEEDEGFIATAPDLPGCSAFGETQEEALSELQSAITASIKALKAAGNPVPPPSRPKAETQHSGKILVRMPRSLHSDLAERAKRENVSLNQYIVVVLARATAEREALDHFTARVHMASHERLQSTNQFRRLHIQPQSDPKRLVITGPQISDFSGNVFIASELGEW